MAAFFVCAAGCAPDLTPLPTSPPVFHSTSVDCDPLTEEWHFLATVHGEVGIAPTVQLSAPPYDESHTLALVRLNPETEVADYASQVSIVIDDADPSRQTTVLTCNDDVETAWNVE